MFVNAIQSVEKALFPIIRITVENPGAPETVLHFGVAGSAFFIDDRGTFVTVAHTFDKRPPNTQYFFCGCLPKYFHPQVEVVEIARDDKADILLGRVPITTESFLTLSPDVAPVGRSVCISGYPLADLSYSPEHGINVSGVGAYFTQTMVIDRMRCEVTGTARIHEGISLQHPALFGQSGGAVFCADSTAVGMQASVTHPRETANDGRKIAVENAVAISSDKILALYERTLGLRTVVPKIDAAVDAAAEHRRSA